MIKKTADLINDKKLEGIADIKDESDQKRYAYRLLFETRCHSQCGVEPNYSNTPNYNPLFNVNQYSFGKRVKLRILNSGF